MECNRLREMLEKTLTATSHPTGESVVMHETPFAQSHFNILSLMSADDKVKVEEAFYIKEVELQ